MSVWNHKLACKTVKQFSSLGNAYSDYPWKNKTDKTASLGAIALILYFFMLVCKTCIEYDICDILRQPTITLLLPKLMVAQMAEALCYKPEGRGFDSFRPHHGPGVNSACNRNEYQG
jgi:hypothetical protein